MALQNAVLDTYTNHREPAFNGSMSFSHAGSATPGNRVVVACFSCRHTANVAGMTVTYGGSTMTLRQYYDSQNDATVAVWTLDLGTGILEGTQTFSESGGTSTGSDAFMTIFTFFSDGYDNSSADTGSVTLTTSDSLGAGAGPCISGGQGTLGETQGTAVYYYSYAQYYDVETGYRMASASTTTLAWSPGYRCVGVAVKGYTPFAAPGTPVACTPFMMI